PHRRGDSRASARNQPLAADDDRDGNARARARGPFRASHCYSCGRPAGGGRTMRSRDLAELAGRNLREALLRNALTTLGIAVGVASLVAMLSLGAGLQELVNKRLTHSGLFDKIFVTSYQNLRALGRPTPQADPGDRESRLLDDTARQQIKRLANVAEVYPEIRFLTEVEYAGRKHLTTVVAVPASARLSDAFEGMQG